mgnify:CR=1 FL=1
MAWVILVGSGVFEAVWATALGKSDGFTKLWPTVVFLLAMTISMIGLAIAIGALAGRHLPERLIRYGAAALFALFGIIMIVQGIRG